MLNGRLIFVSPSRGVVALFKYCEDFREISLTAPMSSATATATATAIATATHS